SPLGIGSGRITTYSEVDGTSMLKGAFRRSTRLYEFWEFSAIPLPEFWGKSGRSSAVPANFAGARSAALRAKLDSHLGLAPAGLDTRTRFGRCWICSRVVCDHFV